MKREQHKKEPEFAPDPELGGGINPLIVWFIIALAFAILGVTATYCGWTPLAFILWALFLICVVRILLDLFKQHDGEYRYRRLYSDSLNAMEKRLSESEDKIIALEKRLNETPHHGTVRPGSKPSIEYLNMVVHKEDRHDVR